MVCAQLIGEHEEADDSESERSSSGGVVLFTQESSEGEEARPRRTEKESVFCLLLILPTCVKIPPLKKKL